MALILGRADKHLAVLPGLLDAAASASLLRAPTNPGACLQCLQH
jgi:hypothetical protein